MDFKDNKEMALAIIEHGALYRRQKLGRVDSVLKLTFNPEKYRSNPFRYYNNRDCFHGITMHFVWDTKEKWFPITTPEGRALAIEFGDIEPEQEPEELKDKQLVWAYDSTDDYGRCLVFYDAINEASFHTATGKRNDYVWANYKPYKGKYPKWARKALKKLED